MKKLFLILVSVLVLGGCSVDDDTSVSGGSVSSGGDDMAITTYPNVVEASRTVVEGGYLVDYFYIGNQSLSLENGIKDFFLAILKEKGLTISDFEKVGKFFITDVVSANFDVGETKSKETYPKYEYSDVERILYKYELGTVDSCFDSTWGRYVYMITFVDLIGNTSGYINSEKSDKFPFSVKGFKGTCVFKGKFTIFEPAR